MDTEESMNLLQNPTGEMWKIDVDYSRVAEYGFSEVYYWDAEEDGWVQIKL